MPSVVSLGEMRTHIRSVPVGADEDNRLRLFGEAATAAVEGYVGVLVEDTFVDVITPGMTLVLPRTPVIALVSITGVYEQTTYPLAGLDVDGATGIVRNVSGVAFSGPVRVTYRAGRTTIPAEIKLAVLDLVLHWWRQSQAHGTATYGGEPVGVTDFSTLPNAVLNKLRPHMPILVA